MWQHVRYLQHSYALVEATKHTDSQENIHTVNNNT